MKYIITTVANPDYKPTDQNVTPFIYDAECDDEVVLATKQAKSQFMAIIVHENIVDSPKIDLEILEILDQLPIPAYKTLYQKAIESNLSEAEINQIWATLDIDVDDSKVYLDEPSIVYLPMNRNREHHLEFIKAYYHYVVDNPDAVIVFDDDSGEELDCEIDLSCYFDLGSDFQFDMDFVIQDGDYWITYDCEKGTKCAFTFNLDLEESDYKPSFPHAVGLNIVANGSYAPIDNIKSVIKALHDKGTFELKLEGTNPVSHPHFIEILDYAHSLGFIITFTTRSIEWSLNKDMIDKVLECVASITFLYDTGDLDNLKLLDSRLYEGFGMYLQLHIQVTPELLSTKELKKLNRWCAQEYKCLMLKGFNGTLTNEKANILMLLKSDDNWKLFFDEVLAQRYNKYIRGRFEIIPVEQMVYIDIGW